MNNLINSDTHAELVDSLKIELYRLKKGYGNNMSLTELRRISDTDFGGLESTKKQTICLVDTKIKKILIKLIDG